MPNWCSNSLEISKHTESGIKLIDAFRENHVDEHGKKFSTPFTDLFPTPSELMNVPADHRGESPEHLANKAKYGHADWYGWRLANWGTKWDACETYISHEDDDSVVVIFETAWSPPTELLAWYAQQNPDVVFVNEFSEEGCCFAGYDCNSASGFDSQCWELHSAPRFEDLMEEIPETEK